MTLGKRRWIKDRLRLGLPLGVRHGRKGGGIVKALVTGGAGFIGTHLVKALMEVGHEPVVLDNLSSGRKENLWPGGMFYQGDIRDREFVMAVLAKEEPEIVWHLAAQSSVLGSLRAPAEDAAINILGTINVLDAAIKHRVRKIIYSSTAAVYGNPENLPIKELERPSLKSGYAVSKYAAELYLAVYHALYGLEYTILRYANVFGPRQYAGADGGVVAVFINNLIQGRQLAVYGDGEQTRDFIYVNDVVQANILAIDRGNGEIINISRGNSTTVNELCRQLVNLSGTKLEITYHPQRAGDIRHSMLDNGAAKSVLGWEPSYAVEEGLRETMARWTDG